MGRPKILNNTITLICEECKNNFTVAKSKHKRKFCSKKCAQQQKSTNKEWLNKRDVTNIEKYGVKSPFESEVIRNKYKQNLINKYGVDNPFLIQQVQDKSKATQIQRYGHEHASQNKEISAKISAKLKEREYNRDRFANIKWEKIISYCSTINISPMFSKQELIDNHVRNPQSKFKFKCNKCDTTLCISLQNGYLPTCGKCSKHKGYSLIEEEIINFIKDNYKGEIILKYRQLLSSGREVDIFLPELKLAIEVNGIYWHSEIWGKYKNYHLSKTEEALSKNINLIHIFDYEWLNKMDIVKSMLLNKLKSIPNKIYARKCKIREVSSNDKQKFLNNNHIQGNCVSKTNIGLYYNNELVSIMTFGKNRFKKDNSIEMIRFCNVVNTNVIGGASKLFNYFIKNYQYETIITFADRRYSIGNLYNVLGFKLNGFTPPSYFYWKNNKIFNRITFQKHKLKDILDKFNPELSEYENALENGFNRIWDCGNYKFIYSNHIIS
jgi:hypothetical protein